MPSLCPDALDAVFARCRPREQLTLATLCCRQLSRRWRTEGERLAAAFAALQRHGLELSSAAVAGVDAAGCLLSLGDGSSEAAVLGCVQRIVVSLGARQRVHASPAAGSSSALVRCSWLPGTFRASSPGAGTLSTTSGRRQEVIVGQQYEGVRLFFPQPATSIYASDASSCCYIVDLRQAKPDALAAD